MKHPETPLGAAIRHLLRERGWSQPRGAREAGIGESTFKAIVQGASKQPGHVRVEKIARSFGLSPDDLAALAQSLISGAPKSASQRDGVPSASLAGAQSRHAGEGMSLRAERSDYPAGKLSISDSPISESPDLTLARLHLAFASGAYDEADALAGTLRSQIKRLRRPEKARE